jgi:hypothetical protein
MTLSLTGETNRDVSKDEFIRDGEDECFIQMELTNEVGDVNHLEIKRWFFRKKSAKIEIWENGSQEWCKNGKQHRDNDLPALVRVDGTQRWYRNGIRHRDGDKPAEINADGTRRWFKDGIEYTPNLPTAEKKALEDPPTKVYSDRKEWHNAQGQLHRDNDLPAVIFSDGSKWWCKNGKMHRDNDLPAEINADGTHCWVKDGIEYTPNLPSAEKKDLEDPPTKVYTDLINKIPEAKDKLTKKVQLQLETVVKVLTETTSNQIKWNEIYPENLLDQVRDILVKKVYTLTELDSSIVISW